MNASQVLDELRAAGIRIELRPHGCIYLTPKNRLTDDMIERVRRYKPELLALLIARHCEATGTGLKDYLAEHQPELLNEPSLATSPAESLIGTCQRYGVALKLDADGRLLVGKAGTKPGEAGYAWPSLLQAIEAHAEAVAALISSGWTLRADFPAQVAA